MIFEALLAAIFDPDLKDDFNTMGIFDIQIKCKILDLLNSITEKPNKNDINLEEEAEKLANEIESSSTYRKNVDKELSDNEEEEEAFSAVSRSPNNNNTGEINNNNATSSNNNSKFYCLSNI